MITIIDYNAGNIRSVLFALERLGIQARLSADPDEIVKADKVIFPGVGEANTTMQYLRERQLDEVIKGLKQPVLGICLGMQLLCTHSEENDTECLGIIPQHVLRFRPRQGEKVPHMGWNSIYNLRSPLFDATLEKEYVYFVHSYGVEPGSYTIATCNYVQPFSAALQKDNFFATQFHPEKSGKVGAAILENFLKL
ncbi:MAG TPA: imidazole glycerol phosphate synthase subunit HisH [Saprospiraceae bacterium]|nr:imidazole glycerol phosphate synthase subunit HisH [Saprospiraceae bacterium]HMQ83678.1 imidazole glycerol phosphate synthase subunit HisH [Saprospiraceae bacterium]